MGQLRSKFGAARYVRYDYLRSYGEINSYSCDDLKEIHFWSLEAKESAWYESEYTSVNFSFFPVRHNEFSAFILYDLLIYKFSALYYR